jgi:hypothetical protein
LFRFAYPCVGGEEGLVRVTLVSGLAVVDDVTAAAKIGLMPWSAAAL